MQILNLLNKKFGKLFVIKYSGLNKANKATWLCKCDCGKEIIVRSCSLTKKNKGTKSCGCLRKNNGKLNGEKKTYSILESIDLILYEYIKSSKRRKIDWKLTRDQFINLISKNCHYCEEAPSKIKKVYKYNGIDRIDNNEGYTLANCVSCCWKCNRMKNNLSIADFINQVIKISIKFKSHPVP